MKKKEAIKKAYGEHWESVKYHVDENGWVNADFLPSLYSEKGLNKEFIQSVPDRSGFVPKFYIRPRCLEGIENNNGWIKVESESDLPTMWKRYFVVDLFNCVSLVTLQEENRQRWVDTVTHYKEIEFPEELPIY